MEDYKYAVTYKGRIVKVFTSYDSAKYFYEKFCDTLSTFELEDVDIAELASDGNLVEAKATKNHKDYSEVDENGYTTEEVEAILKAAEGPFEDISFEDFCKL